MDRLVCGDVGFGKTEVALRGAFYNAMAGRQVALLCPTTVLLSAAFQHLFRALFGLSADGARHGCRFESKGRTTEHFEGLKEGSVDVVIGTHRLLS